MFQNTKDRGNESGPLSQDPVQDLINQAEQHVDHFEYELALQFCQRAMDLDANNLAAMEMAAGLFLEAGEPQKAKTHLVRAVQLNPDKGHSKYLSLAQLLHGQAAVDCYCKGIEIMKTELESTSKDSDDDSVLRRELSDAYCAAAELFTTDLCDEPNAEEQCVENIEKAIAVDPNNPEAYLCNANYLLIRNKRPEAKQMLQKSLTFWFPQLQAILEGTPVDEQFDPIDICALPYNSRVSTVKLLIELEDYETGSDILEALLSENDEDIEVWYLSGLLNYLRGEDFKSNARYYLKKAQRLILKTGEEDEEMSADIESMLSELGPGNPEDDESSDEDKENMNGNDESDGSIVEDSDGEAPMET